MSGTVDQRRRDLTAPAAAPFTAAQERRLREIVREERATRPPVAPFDCGDEAFGPGSDRVEVDLV